MRYFETTNASLPLKLGRFDFQFEPIELFGGAWRGILKTDDVAAGEALAAYGGSVTEVTEEKFEQLKKKWLRVEPKVQASPSSSAEALARHQLSQGVQAAAPGSPSKGTSSASTVGKLETAVVNIIDDLSAGPQEAERPAPPRKETPKAPDITPAPEEVDD